MAKRKKVDVQIPRAQAWIPAAVWYSPYFGYSDNQSDQDAGGWDGDMSEAVDDDLTYVITGQDGASYKVDEILDADGNPITDLTVDDMNIITAAVEENATATEMPEGDDEMQTIVYQALDGQNKNLDDLYEHVADVFKTSIYGKNGISRKVNQALREMMDSNVIMQVDDNQYTVSPIISKNPKYASLTDMERELLDLRDIYQTWTPTVYLAVHLHIPHEQIIAAIQTLAKCDLACLADNTNYGPAVKSLVAPALPPQG